MRKIAFIGAGLTSLSAAFGLAEEGGYEITIIDQAPEVGGLSRSIEKDGFVSDLGPHRFYTIYPEISEFVKKLLGDEFINVERKSRIYIKGRFLDYPVKTSEVLSTFGVASSFGSVFSFGSQKVKKLFSRKEPDNYEEYIISNFGENLYKLLFHDYTKKVWGVEPSTISADVARARIPGGGLGAVIKEKLLGASADSPSSVKSLGYIKGGIGNLPKKMAAELEKMGVKFMLNAKMTDIRPKSEMMNITLMHDDKQVPIWTDLCVSTIPLGQLAQMFLKRYPSPELMQDAASLKQINAAFVFLIVNRPKISDDNWLYFPEDNTIFNRGYEAKNFCPTLGPKDKSMICLEVTYLKGAKKSRLSDEEVIAKVKEDFVGTGLVKAEEIESGFCLREDDIYPLYTIDYAEKVDGILDYLTKFSSLYTAGRQGLFNHNNMDHCLYMGFMLAESIIDGEKPAQWYENVEEFRNFKIVD